MQSERVDSSLRWFRLIPCKATVLDFLMVRGFALHLALRKMEFERQVRAALQEGVRQIVVIGAGFDALALRLCREFPNVHCFELDRLPTQSVKREAMGALPPNLHLVACDLSLISLADVLKQQPGFTIGAPTLFLAEGLTMYLTDEENRKWLADTRQLAGAGTRIVFSAIEALPATHGIAAVFRSRRLQKRGNRFRWAIDSKDVAAFLQECGFHLQQTQLYSELQRPYRSEREMRLITQVKGENIYLCQSS